MFNSCSRSGAGFPQYWYTTISRIGKTPVIIYPTMLNSRYDVQTVSDPKIEVKLRFFILLYKKGMKTKNPLARVSPAKKPSAVVEIVFPFSKK